MKFDLVWYGEFGVVVVVVDVKYKVEKLVGFLDVDLY